MKRILTLSILHLALCTLVMALPPKREVLDSLLQAGDTARYHQMINHGRFLAERVAQVQSRRTPAQTQTATPLNIAPRGLVILVNFQDKEFITSYDEMHDMINGDNYTRTYRSGYKTIKAQGSARQYFIDQSWGQYQPQFDVVGPYTVSKDMSYYGENDWSGNDKNPHKMIIEACQLADADGVDFTLYDNNRDGEIDFVYVFYAGYGEADGGAANTIWPHTFWVKDGNGENVKVDGKYINAYACGNELSYGTQIHDGVGTFCHEFSHVLGLPDLYYTGQSWNYNTKLLGTWDIMDAGPYNNDGNTPPAYSAYERFFMGWLKPTQLTGNKDITLHELNSSRGAGLIAAGTHNMKGNDPNPTTFYMLENRKQEGWDKYLPGKGLLLTKIQYSYAKWTQNTVNNTKTAMGVDIIEADGDNSYTYEAGKASDAFPSGAFSYSGIPNYTLDNIRWGENKDDILIRLNTGGFPLEIGTFFTANEIVEDNTLHSAKCIIDGQVVIIREGVMYDMMGRPIQ